MALTNLNNLHLSAEEKKKIEDLVSQLEETLAPKIINLSAEDRQRYGSISEQNKLFVNKVYDYARTQPSLKSPDVEWEEFFADIESRNFTEMLMARLEKLTIGVRNAKTLHDYDNFQASLNDYAYTTYKAGTSAKGYEKKLIDLKQFFQRSKNK